MCTVASLRINYNFVALNTSAEDQVIVLGCRTTRVTCMRLTVVRKVYE